MLSALLKPAKRETTVVTDDKSTAQVVTRRPVVRAVETETGFELVAEMPGVTADQIEVTIDQGTITVSGIASSAQPASCQLLYREYQPGRFSLSYQLPSDVDRDGITATSRHGLVQVALPKLKAMQPKRIAVRAG